MHKGKSKLTMDRPELYAIKVPGRLEDRWPEWNDFLTVEIDCEGDEPPVTTISGTMDQAALHGLLRRLYALGLPLISVNWIVCDGSDVRKPGQGMLP